MPLDEQSIRSAARRSARQVAPSKTFMSPMGMHRLGAAQASKRPGAAGASHSGGDVVGVMSKTQHLLALMGSDGLRSTLPAWLHTQVGARLAGPRASTQVQASQTSRFTLNFKGLRVVCSDPGSGCVAIDLHLLQGPSHEAARMEHLQLTGSVAVSSPEVPIAFSANPSQGTIAAAETAESTLPPVLYRLRQHLDRASHTDTGMLLPTQDDSWVAVQLARSSGPASVTLFAQSRGVDGVVPLPVAVECTKLAGAGLQLTARGRTWTIREGRAVQSRRTSTPASLDSDGSLRQSPDAGQSPMVASQDTAGIFDGWGSALDGILEAGCTAAILQPSSALSSAQSTDAQVRIAVDSMTSASAAVGGDGLGISVSHALPATSSSDTFAHGTSVASIPAEFPPGKRERSESVDTDLAALAGYSDSDSRFAWGAYPAAIAKNVHDARDIAPRVRDGSIRARIREVAVELNAHSTRLDSFWRFVGGWTGSMQSASVLGDLLKRRDRHRGGRSANRADDP